MRVSEMLRAKTDWLAGSRSPIAAIWLQTTN
jgi:hypothetical protein